MHPRPPIPIVIQQHCEDATILRGTRSSLVSGHVKLLQLARLDERLAAHLDGLIEAGAHGALLVMQAQERPSVGSVFCATTLAIESRNTQLLGQMLAIAQSLPEVRKGALSAFGWVEAGKLQGLIQPLFDAPEPFHREVALAACAMHGVNPGAALQAALADSDAGVRERALRLVGELGLVDQLNACLARLADDSAACAFAAARAAVLLGDRGQAMAALTRMAAAPGPWRADAMQLLLRVLPNDAARELLRNLAQEAGDPQLLIDAVGAAGDVHYVPWLIQQMSQPAFARRAGESFAMLAGLDLALLDLDRKPPEADSTPAEGDEAAAAVEEDLNLPWPAPERIEAWWQVNANRFQPGVRYFVGQAPSIASVTSELNNGFQRRRVAAAQYRCLLAPGTPLFNTAAPAWRQQKLLGARGTSPA